VARVFQTSVVAVVVVVVVVVVVAAAAVAVVVVVAAVAFVVVVAVTTTAAFVVVVAVVRVAFATAPPFLVATSSASLAQLSPFVVVVVALKPVSRVPLSPSSVGSALAIPSLSAQPQPATAFSPRRRVLDSSPYAARTT